MTGAVVVLATLAVVVGFGLYRRFTDGRSRRPSGSAAGFDATRFAQPLGAAATLVQFSSEFCAPCRTTAATLAEVAAENSGIRHVELDAAEHLELTSELGITRTPTVLVVDAAGAIRHRILGATRKPEVLRLLDELGTPAASRMG